MYIGLTIFYYIILSAIGMLFVDENGIRYTFTQCTSNHGWFVFYIAFIHWGLVIISLRDYYINHVEKIKNL